MEVAQQSSPQTWEEEAFPCLGEEGECLVLLEEVEEVEVPYPVEGEVGEVHPSQVMVVEEGVQASQVKVAEEGVQAYLATVEEGEVLASRVREEVVVAQAFLAAEAEVGVDQCKHGLVEEEGGQSQYCERIKEELVEVGVIQVLPQVQSL